MDCIKSIKLARSKFLGCQLGTNSYIFTCQNTGPIASSESSLHSLHHSIPLALSEVSLICSRTLNSPSKLRKVFKVFSKSHWQKHIKTSRRKKTLENTVHNWNVVKNVVKCESMHRNCAETLWKLWGSKCIKMPAVRFDHDSDAWLPERQPLRKPLRWKKAMLSTTGGYRQKHYIIVHVEYNVLRFVRDKKEMLHHLE